MLSSVVIINAYDANDTFIAALSREYTNTLLIRQVIPEVLLVNKMNFSFTPFPEQYVFDTLETDLQRSVKAIKMASTVTIFTSSQKDKHVPAFRQFISRLFHLKAGAINSGIWGNMGAYSKIMRIVTVLDDPETWQEFHIHKNKSVVPIPKISFGLFGFGQVFTRTFGYLKNSDLEGDYAKKSLKAMRDMADKD